MLIYLCIPTPRHQEIREWPMWYSSDPANLTTGSEALLSKYEEAVLFDPRRTP